MSSSTLIALTIISTMAVRCCMAIKVGSVQAQAAWRWCLNDDSKARLEEKREAITFVEKVWGRRVLDDECMLKVEQNYMGKWVTQTSATGRQN